MHCIKHVYPALVKVSAYTGYMRKREKELCPNGGGGGGIFSSALVETSTYTVYTQQKCPLCHLRCMTTADVQVQYTESLHTLYSGSKAIIIIDVAFYQAITVLVISGIIRYVLCGQVQIASNLICLHALSSANE